MDVTLDITERYTVWRTYRVKMDAPVGVEDGGFKDWFYDEWCYENDPGKRGVLLREEEEYDDMVWDAAEEDVA